MGGDTDDQDLERALGTAQLLLNLIGSSFYIDGCRNIVAGQGVDPAAVRDSVRRSAGAPMTPPPDQISRNDFVEWHGDSGEIRTPIWTESGRSPLHVLIAVHREFDEGVDMEFWGAFVSGVVDEFGVTVLTVDDAPAPAPPDFPVWSEPREGRWAADPRIPRGAFTGFSYGVRFGQLLDGISRVHPDLLDALDQLNDGQAAMVLLHTFFSGLDGDGIVAGYRSLAVDGAPGRLAAAAALVGADAYAEVFEAVEQSLPPDARHHATTLRSHLEDLEDAAWDAGDPDSPLEEYEDTIFRLADDGDVVWRHLARYVEQHPDQFFTPE